MAGLVSRLTKGAEDLAVLIQFDNPVVSAVHHPNVLVWCNRQTVGVADISPLLDELTLRIKDLNALILAIANIHAALVVDGDTMRQIEFADACSVFSPSLDEVTVTIKLYDTRIAIAIRYVNISVLRESHVGGLVEQPICLCPGVDSAQNQQDIAGRVQLEHKMASVISRPKIVVGVDAQAMRVREESVANALNKVTLRVIFGEHGLGSLKQKDMALGIYSDRRGFAGDRSLWKLKEVRHNTIRKFGNRLKWGSLHGCLLRR